MDTRETFTKLWGVYRLQDSSFRVQQATEFLNQIGDFWTSDPAAFSVRGSLRRYIRGTTSIDALGKGLKRYFRQLNRRKVYFRQSLLFIELVNLYTQDGENALVSRIKELISDTSTSIEMTYAYRWTLRRIGEEG